MKRIVFSIIAAVGLASTTMAGGLLTNSNQSASFLRNPGREAVIDIDGVYVNPAGVAFMNKGFHFGLTGMNAHQSRDVVTTFPTLGYNMENPGQTSRRYKGDALAPVAPCFSAAYVWDRWTVGAHFAFGSGGGRCEYKQGIGSIESAYSALLMSTFGSMGVTGYKMDSYMKGAVYHYCVSLGTSYKVLDNLSVAGGLRMVNALSNYTGYVRDIQLYKGGVYDPNVSGYCLPYYVNMDTDQKGIGWTPYLSVDWKLNEHWNFAAKYEFKTRLRMENDTKEMTAPDLAKPVLAKFDESQNKTIAEDLPAILTAGVQYSPISTVRLSTGWHYYFDKQATKFQHKEDMVEKGSMEFTWGAEWDCLKWLTASAGWQTTCYRLKEGYMSDMDFALSSNLFGLGVRLHVADFCSVDLSYFKSFYKRRDVETANYMGSGFSKNDHYVRDNYTFGLGVNFDF